MRLRRVSIFGLPTPDPGPCRVGLSRSSRRLLGQQLRHGLGSEDDQRAAGGKDEFFNDPTQKGVGREEGGNERAEQDAHHHAQAQGLRLNQANAAANTAYSTARNPASSSNSPFMNTPEVAWSNSTAIPLWMTLARRKATGVATTANAPARVGKPPATACPIATAMQTRYGHSPWSSNPAVEVRVCS